MFFLLKKYIECQPTLTQLISNDIDNDCTTTTIHEDKQSNNEIVILDNELNSSIITKLDESISGNNTTTILPTTTATTTKEDDMNHTLSLHKHYEEQQHQYQQQQIQPSPTRINVDCINNPTTIGSSVSSLSSSKNNQQPTPSMWQALKSNRRTIPMIGRREQPMMEKSVFKQDDKPQQQQHHQHQQQQQQQQQHNNLTMNVQKPKMVVQEDKHIFNPVLLVQEKKAMKVENSNDDNEEEKVDDNRDGYNTFSINEESGGGLESVLDMFQEISEDNGMIENPSMKNESTFDDEDQNCIIHERKNISLYYSNLNLNTTQEREQEQEKHQEQHQEEEQQQYYGQIIIDFIERNVLHDLKVLRALKVACPKWKENISFVFHQEDPDEVESALGNVQESIRKTAEMKERIMNSLYQQNCVLRLFEAALIESLRNLNGTRVQGICYV